MVLFAVYMPSRLGLAGGNEIAKFPMGPEAVPRAIGVESGMQNFRIGSCLTSQSFSAEAGHSCAVFVPQEGWANRFIRA